VIGVVGNASEANLTDSAVTARYMLYDQTPYVPSSHSIVLRLDRPEMAPGALSAAQRTIHRVAPSVAIEELTTMERVFALAVGPARQVMGLLTVLTALAMLLGAIGVYGVISHFVNRRMRDWGIRMALGLAPGRVIGQVVGRGVALVAVGAVIGAAGAFVGSRLLSSLLYGVKAGDPLSLALATLALLLAGALAAYAPAYRASRVDPATVLREQ
jgi:putative ABC transport system permease protein